MDWNPLRSVINQALRSNLEKYVSNIDFDSLGVGGGAIVLRDLELRQESFPSHKGFRLARGFVKELRLSIPWTQLLSASVLVEVRTCEVVFVQQDEYFQTPNGESVGEEEEEEAMGGGESERADPGAEEGGWISEMIKTIAANATLDVSNLVLKLERGADLVAAVSLKSLLLCTCDASSWEKRFQRPSEPFGELFKSLEIGGLTINVERRQQQQQQQGSAITPPRKTGATQQQQPATAGSSFEFPVLNRTDARVRICLRLSPGVAPEMEEREESISASSSLTNLFQRVGNIVAPTQMSFDRELTSAAAAAHGKTNNALGREEEDSAWTLSRTRDPFLHAVTDPMNHGGSGKPHPFVMGADVWIERLDFSISEQQLGILFEMLKPPVAVASPEAPAPAAPEVPALPVSIQEEPAPASSSSSRGASSSWTSGWTSWPLLSSSTSEAPPASVPQPLVKSISISGLRIDRCSLSLMLHTKFQQPQHTHNATPSTAKKAVVAVKTPTGVVYVEDDDEEEVYRRRAQQQQQRRRLVTFCEIVLRSITVQACRIVGDPIAVLLDVESVEATRWHEEYLSKSSEFGMDDKTRHDVFFTWFGRTEESGANRVCLPHPHSKWNFWAHPSALALPALRAAIHVPTTKPLLARQVKMDVALAPLSLTLDALLLRGAKHFIPNKFSPSAATSAAKPKTSEKKDVELLLTCTHAQLTLANAESSLRLDVNQAHFAARRGGKYMDLGVDYLDATMQSSALAKRVFHASEMQTKLNSSGAMDASVLRASLALSPVQVNLLCGIANELGDRGEPLPFTVHLDSSLSDHIALELILNQVSFESAHAFNTARCRLREITLGAIAGKSHTVFSSKLLAEMHQASVEEDFASVALVLDKQQRLHQVEARLGRWELDWSALIKCAQFASHFSPTRSRQAFPPPPSYHQHHAQFSLPPRITLDLEPGRLLLSSTTGDTALSEVLFPHFSIRTVQDDGGNQEGNSEYVWAMDGSRIILNNHAVLVNAKLTGTLTSNAKRLTAHVFPLLLDFSHEHLTCLHTNLQALVLALPKRETRTSSSTVKEASMELQLVLDDVNITMRLLDDDTTDERTFGSDPISDVPSFVSLHAKQVRFAHAGAGESFQVEFGQLTLCEEDWQMFAFREENLGGGRISLRSEQEEDVLNISLAPFDCNLRGGALHAPMAVLSRFPPPVSTTPTAAAAKVKRPLRVELAMQPCTFSVPITSTLCSPQVSLCFLNLPQGLHWTNPPSRALGGAFEFGWGRQDARTGILAVEDVWLAMAPPLVQWLDGKGSDGGCHVHWADFTLCLKSKLDIVRIQTAALALVSRSQLQAVEVSKENKPSQPAATASSPPPLPISLSFKEITLRVVEDNLLHIALANLSYSPSNSNNMGGLRGGWSFSSICISSLNRQVLLSHEFALNAHVCELSNAPISVEVEPIVLEALFMAFLDPISRLNTSLLPRRRRRRARTSAAAPMPSQPQQQAMKILLPHVRIALHSKHQDDAGPCLVARMARGIGSMSSSTAADLTLAAFELVLLGNNNKHARGAELKLVPETDIRLFGEVASRQFSLDLADLQFNLGLENAAICLAIARAFQDLFQTRFAPFARRHFKSSSEMVESVAAAVEESRSALLDASSPPPPLPRIIAPEEIGFANSFEMLLDDTRLEIDPSPGQLVYSNQAAVPGFKFRFPQGERRVASINIAGSVVLLERALVDFSALELACEFLVYDALRERWTQLADFTLHTTCAAAAQANAEENGDNFANAFSSWMEAEVTATPPTLPQAPPAPPSSLKTLGEAGELYWIRWKPLETMSNIQRVAISNAIARTLSLSCFRVAPPLLDVKINTLNVTMHVLHDCSGTQPASELLMLRAPQSKLRIVLRSKQDWLLLMDHHRLCLDVNNLANFTRSTAVRASWLYCELAPSLLDLNFARLEVDLQPESMQILSHALRGVVADFSPPQARLRQRVETYKQQQLQQTSNALLASRTCCSCARVCLENLTGQTVWFKREGEEEESATSLLAGEKMAYSWTSCLCTAATSTPHRALLFSFDAGGRWTRPVDLEQMGTVQVDVLMKEEEETCDLWVSIQLGEPTIQTMVTLHASNVVVNKCQMEIEILPIHVDNTQHGEQVIQLPPALQQQHRAGTTTRFMQNAKRCAGWMFRAAATTAAHSAVWSSPVVLTPNKPPVLVEIPSAGGEDGAARACFVWVNFFRATAEEEEEEGEANGGVQWWSIMELTPSYFFENRTAFDLTVRVRPEHRWESLQYALQSVALSTTPPGPAGTWLTLPPNNNSSHGSATTPPQQPSRSTSSEHLPQQQPQQQHGAVLAQELLRSVHSPLSASSSPKHFSSSLDLSSALAEGSSTEYRVSPGQCIALTVDPRESHALLIGLDGSSSALAPPLRLHANMFHTNTSWQKCIALSREHAGSSSSCTAIALAQNTSSGGEASTCVELSLSPLFLLHNALDRALVWAPVSMVNNQAQVDAPRVLPPGERIAIHSKDCDGLMLACNSEQDDASSLQWSDAFALVEGAVNLSIPLSSSTEQQQQHVHANLVLQICATTNSERLCVVTSRIKLCSEVEDLFWACAGLAPSALPIMREMSMPSQHLGDGGLCAVIEISSGSSRHTLLLDALTESGASAYFVLAGRLLSCHSSAERGVFVLRQELQPRFILENKSPAHAVEMASCSSSTTTPNKNSSSRISSKIVLAPNTRIPFDWRCFDHLTRFEEDGSGRIVQHLKRRSSTITSTNEERFFVQERDEKMRLRMVLASAGEDAFGLGFWQPNTEKGWSPVVATTSGMVYTFHLGNILVSPAPLETGAKLLSISSANQTAIATAAAAAAPPRPLRLVRFRMQSLLGRFSTGSDTAAAAAAAAADVLLFGMDELRAEAKLCSSTNLCELDASIQHAQLESLLPNIEFPIVAAFQQSEEAEKEEALHLRTSFSLSEPRFFTALQVSVSPLAVSLEDETLKQWLLLFAPLLASMTADWKLLERPRTRASRALFVCEQFDVSAIQCLLTIKTTTAQRSMFLGMDRTPVYLWPVSVTHARCSWDHLRNELGANYLADILLSSPALLGSLDLLGNPTGLIRSLAAGVHDLVAIPFRELKRGSGNGGPRKLLRSVALGWLRLLSHVADGALTSVSGFSASLARNLHLSTQERGGGVLASVAGMVIRPAENAAFLVSRTTRRITTRLRPALIRLTAPSPPASNTIMDVERMLAWKVLDNVPVLRTSLCELDVDEEKDGARHSIEIRLILTRDAVCALRGRCLFHDKREWAFSHAWSSVVHVQESLSRPHLAVLIIRSPADGVDKLLRFTFNSDAERRGFVLDALACIQAM